MSAKTPTAVSLCLLAMLLPPDTHLFAQPAPQKVAVPPARVPDGVKAHRDLAYVENGHERHKLDLFVPEKAEGPLPLIIWVHGGGWQNGSKEGCPPLRNGYTERGYAVASINYRLSGHAAFPAQIEDCKGAIRWLRAHGKEYNLDPKRFGVWGSSAGGHLVALLGTSGDVKEFDVGANLDQSSRVQAVCDYYGPTDFTVFVTTPGYESHARAEAPEGKLIGGAVLENKDKAARANPVTFVSKDDPPFLIVHGDEDKTVPINQSQLLYAALKKTGVSAHFHTIKGAGHGQGFGGPEIEPMVSAFFDKQLKSRTPPANLGEMRISDSVASTGGAVPAGRGKAAAPTPTGQGRMTWEQVRRIEGVADDGRVPREEFKGPSPLFDRLDRNRDGVLTKEDFTDPPAPASPKKSVRAPRDPSGGVFLYAKEGYESNTAPIANPDVLGNWVQFYWSDIEKEKGRYDWSLIDSRMKPWVDAGKKVAFRVYWVGSGYWRNPAARVATPASVWADGAKFVKHADSGTEIPLIWDPVYQRRAFAFLAALAERYDGNTNVLFFDVTPGAETNPYRFVAFNQRTPEFKNQYAATPASDGRKYSDELWQATVREWIDATDRIFKQLPLVVTLNVGTLNLGDAQKDYSVEIGQYAVDRGFYVGQNGLHGGSYIEDSGRKTAFLKWSKQTRIVFETLGDAGTKTAYGKKALGTLREIVDAANRVNAHYLLPYPVDVIKGTKGQPNYDPEFGAALAHGAKTLGKTKAQAAAPAPVAAATPTPAPAPRPNSNAKGNPDTRNRPATWLLPPVEGANLHNGTFDSKTAGEKVSYLIYLPPGYEQSKDKRYPVVYWLHGIGGSQQGVPGMTERLTSAIEAGKAPPFLWVFVNGMIRSWYVDAANGKYPVETVTLKELIPHIDATYRTVASREGRMIEGFSMGGAGTARWGFKHPELFGSISVLAGALGDNAEAMNRRDGGKSFEEIYGGKMENYEAENLWKWTEKNAGQVRGRTTIRVAVGGKDQLQGTNTRYHELLDKLSLAHDFDVVPDAIHSPNPVYEGLGDKNWEFYRRAFAQVAPPKSGGSSARAQADAGAKAQPAAAASAAAPKQNPKGGATKAGGAARDRAPTWLMPPVEGANLHYLTFDSKTVGEKVSYLLYLPPGYEQQKAKRYPVVYWLHGIGGAQTGVPGITARLTSAIEAGKTPPFLMVFVNGMIRSSYVDSADGKIPVETVTIKELIPHVDAMHRTIATRAGRMIEGFSMGGGGAAKWGFKHPELFGSISIVDGALHGSGDTSGRATDTLERVYGGDTNRFAANDPWKLAEKNADAVRGRTVIRVLTGSRMLTGTNTKYHELLDSLKLAHDFDVIADAAHSPSPMYEGLGDKNWAFYKKAFALVATAQAGGSPVRETAAADTKPAPAAPTPAAPAPPAPSPAAVALASAPEGFHLDGERWTYRDGAFVMNGFLVKPEGKGPFPAVLISHGLGGTAENFGMAKAREMVKWGFVCIAPDYTHSAKFLSGARPGAGKAGAPKGGAQKGGAPKGAPTAGAPGTNAPRSLPAGYANYGASAENLRRAKTCIELVSKMPEVDATRIAAYGHSMGGFVTIGLAATQPDLLKAAAFSGSGVAPRDGFPAPSVTAAEKIRTPFLMVHGSLDNTVRPSQSEQLKEVLDKNKVPNERHVFEGENHPVDQTKREEVFKLIREWFTKHGVLKAD